MTTHAHAWRNPRPKTPCTKPAPSQVRPAAAVFVRRQVRGFVCGGEGAVPTRASMFTRTNPVYWQEN